MSETITCTKCMLIHPPPQCDHNPESPCADCGRNKGYRFTLDDGTQSDGTTCAACWWRRGL